MNYIIAHFGQGPASLRCVVCTAWHAWQKSAFTIELAWACVCLTLYMFSLIMLRFLQLWSKPRSLHVASLQEYLCIHRFEALSFLKLIEALV